MSSDQPLSRRELRALREAELAAGAAESQQADAASDDSPRETPDSAEFAATDKPEDAPAQQLEERPLAQSASEPLGQFSAESADSEPESAVSGETEEDLRSNGRNARGNWRVWLSILVLAAIAAGLAMVNLLNGPRLLEVRVDPAAATQASGSRVILTANQAVHEITPEQVTITPETPFTVDTAGRDIGIRFTIPLDAATEYTLNIAGVGSPGSSQTSTFETNWTTPASHLFVLERNYGTQLDQLIPVTIGAEPATPVFEHPYIIDFRQHAGRLVVSLEQNDNTRLVVMNTTGENRRDLPLPGEGWIQSLQIADRGNLAGYLFTDAGIGSTSDRGSVLVIESLEGEDQGIVTIAGEEVNVQQWQFIPDTRALLMITYDGGLFLVDTANTDADPQPLGNALEILGVSRGTPIAYIDRPDGVVTINLETGEELPLTLSEGESLTQLVALPEGSLRWVVGRTPEGDPTSQRIALMTEGTHEQTVAEIPMTDQIVQVCASPSGQYAAVVTAPDVANNPSDFTLLPLPEELLTTIYDLRSDAFTAVATHAGFDPSWCAVAPYL